jgi:sugar lactone lactonase YvrE
MVLDAQASEVRAFDPEGSFLGVVARRGEGPGEIVRANGIRFDSTGALWINDHGRRQITRLGGGAERAFATYPAVRNAFGYLWEGGVTRDGRVWDAEQHADGPQTSVGQLQPGDPTGPQNLERRLYFKSLDPRTGALDSVALGTVTNFVALYPRVSAFVPFAPIPLLALDPAGAIWTAASGAYRLTRHSLTGDTLLVIELPGEGPAVSADERAAEITKIQEFLAGVRRGGGTAGQGSEDTDWESVIPQRKPILVGLSVDDRGRLWVQRRTEAGVLFDVFAPTGELVGTVEPAFEPWPFFPPVVRGAQMLALVTDSLDVPSVVRAAVPLR